MFLPDGRITFTASAFNALNAKFGQLSKIVETLLPPGIRDFKTNMHQIIFRLGLLPRSRLQHCHRVQTPWGRTLILMERGSGEVTGGKGILLCLKS